MANASQHRRAFTLIELVVVIAIIALLMALLIPMVMRSMRQGKRARFAADLQAITVGLDAYKADFGDYPRFPQVIGVPAGQPDALTNRGARLLCSALLGPGPATIDGADGPGFRLRPSGLGKIWGPYIAVDKFKASATNGTGVLLDQDAHPVLYFPGKTGTSDIRTIGSKGYCFPLDPTSAAYPAPPQVVPLYNLWDNQGFIAPGAAAQILGDSNANGEIDGTETPNYQGPYILWSAGVDGNYGLDGDGKTDDVTNFEYPPALLKAK